MDASRKLSCGVAFVFWCVFVRQAGAVTYHLTDLGSLGGTASYASGIGPNGQVLGYSFIPPDGLNAYATVYTGGVLVNLGRPYGGYTDAIAMNAKGQITGIGDALNSNHPFVYENGVFTDLKPAGMSAAGGINSSSQIAGTANGHAVIYSNGSITDLGTLGATSSEATTINDTGQVVGSLEFVYLNASAHHPFLWSGGSMVDLGALPGGLSTWANDINSNGTIVGTGEIATFVTGVQTKTRAYVERNGTRTILEPFFGGRKSGAYAVNSLDQVVGFADYSGDSSHGFLYSGNVMQDLNSMMDISAAGWNITDAVGINDHGWIAANAKSNSGLFNHAVLLTPTPEPAALGTIACLALLGRRNRRRVRDRKSS